ncbi:serine/threonine protein kinase, putative [Entamoeba invadens IP1]|uniref:Serine/threonine protein kinase, putative n=1 Tax=Entamoeba invadens IP1 TaxID=370355 RepID=A0A0A1TZC6_ENTIV|nr:serine/threonine protein kinase, putative [Entamoeba invadens IP1]ELP83873.1 serine/threonine protein kinase, putative [Entamoeba invadens IP1]|eukprot:XP_004183219.1 serine/threonine protein kinase, putative [Entamoeba invadens IP1]
MNKNPTTTIFHMKNSNVRFTTIRGGLCCNLSEIDFNSEIEEIPVDKEIRQLLCVGNSKERAVKIQFTLKEQNEKFRLRMNPEIVTLKRGYACEVEILLLIRCTLKIKSEVLIVSKNLQSNLDIFNSIRVKAKSEISTKLDPDEITLENELGSGSFGVVYKGKFRGNVVAVKKMRRIISDDFDQMKEFMKEVNMLAKFRSEYIVHFYGAVFIPNKICVVTEFAAYGSLFGVIKREEKIELKVLIRMLLNAARGLEYLHLNGILHRDIKPDNILIFSFNVNEKANAKLTDFGSARNVNMMMTNMTFTNGIGTPAYMAPEIFSKDKYKMPADIYSFGMTMYECLNGKFAYQSDTFKYPWNVVNFVTKGNRMQKPDTIGDKEFEIIKMCWKQKAEERIKVEDLVERLENLFV